jgi:prepilin-type N-terminal cleavage/methylation domain-containing protein
VIRELRMKSGLRTESGFSLLEVLVSMTITLIALGVAFTALEGVSGAREAATLLTDNNQSLRTSLNLMTRDLLSAGRDVLVGGIPIPSGNAAPLVRPSPAGTALTFPASNITLQAVTPGPGLGPAVNGIATDVISILMVDTSLPLGDSLTNVAADGSSVTVDPAFPIDGAGNGIQAGDLIWLGNGVDDAIQMVTGRAGQTIQFAAGDPMNLNQRGAERGTVLQMQQPPGAYPETTAHRVLMISYYLDASNPARPRLMRRINLGQDRAIGIDVENLQITYDLVDGVTNPVNVEAPVAPNTPAQIRKANVFLSGRSHRPWSRTQQFLRNTLSTQVSLRSLSFFDRYPTDQR